MSDVRTHREESIPIIDTIDEYLVAHGWTIRNPQDGREEANYGDSVYVHPQIYGGRARGWLDAVVDQADMEADPQKEGQ